MHRRAAATLLAATLLFSAGNGKLKRLSSTERDHYDALRVWMDKKQDKAYLKLKTEEERNAWLQDMGLWDRFYQYDKDVRDDIVAGNVRVGWTTDKVFMAWGPPHQRKRLSIQGVPRSEALVYLLEVTEDGSVLVWEPGSKETHHAVARYRYELIVHEVTVAEMIRKEGWDY